MSFLSKDNHKWLQTGVSGLTSSAANALVSAIQSHWHRLWPEPVTDYFSESYKQTSKKFGSFSGDSSLQLVIHTFEKSALWAFLSLASELGYGGKIVLCVTRSEWEGFSSQEQDSLRTSGIQLEVLSKPFVLQSDWLNYTSTEAQWLGVVNCQNMRHLLDKTKQVMRWYAMLGFEFGLQQLLSFNQGDSPDYMMAPYHPTDLPTLQNRPRFYPDAHQFWLNRAMLPLAQTIKGDNALVWVTLLLQAMKRENAKLAVLHQYFMHFFNR